MAYWIGGRAGFVFQLETSRRQKESKKMSNCGRISFLLTLFLIVPQQAAATTALYSLSYGARSAGMAGATLASSGDALNQFLNPANLSFLPK